MNGKVQGVKQRLLNISKKQRLDFNLILNRYCAERFLYRLSNSKYVDFLSLKGASLLYVWSGNMIWATRDIDFMSTVSLDHNDIRIMIIEIMEGASSDMIIFNSDEIVMTDIREQEKYHGVRVKFFGFLGNAKIPCQLDIAFGDSVTSYPEKHDYPILLDDPKPVLKMYPIETVIAEKFQIIVSLGMLNSRLKDYFDLWLIITTYEIDKKLIVETIKKTFKHRNTDVPVEIPEGLSELFSEDILKIKQWKAFISRAGIQYDVLDLKSLVEIIRESLMYWANL